MMEGRITTEPDHKNSKLSDDSTHDMTDDKNSGSYKSNLHV